MESQHLRHVPTSWGFRDATARGKRYAVRVKPPSSNQVKIGITSPLINGQTPTADMGATQHRVFLERLGATPVLLHNDDDPLTVIEQFGLMGLIFSGGEEDIATDRYGGDAYFARDMDLRRDAFEFALMEQALAAKIPVLAVCRGMQIANVLLKGTLVEDLRRSMGSAYSIMHDQVAEGGYPYHQRIHEISIISGTLLHAIAGVERLSVNSIHHQAIGTLAPGLRVIAIADDGVIEAVEFVNPGTQFFLGVQWHPEWLRDDAVSEQIYSRLIEECAVRQRVATW